MNADRFNDVLSRWELWWQRKNTAPLFNIICSTGKWDGLPAIKPWMDQSYRRGWTMWEHEMAFGHAVELTWKSGDWRYVDEVLEFLYAYGDITDYAAEGFPFLYATLGSMMMPALLTNYTHFNNGTIWVQPEPSWEWEQIEQITETSTTPYAEVAIKALERLTRRLAGRFVIAPPELGEPLDVLASLRGPQNLAMDMLDCAERVHKALDVLDRRRTRFSDQFDALVDAANGHHAYVKVMRYLSARPTMLAACDFSAMISPDLFAEFYLPCLRRTVKQYGDRVVYHMDGPGQIAHADHLCSVEKLHGVQWVYGAGNPDNLSDRWDGLYRKLLNAGKRIYFCGASTDAEVMRAFFRKFPAREFYLPYTLGSRAEAEKVLRVF